MKFENKKNEDQKVLYDVLGTRPIAFNPDLSRALGSVAAGLFMSQLLFWFDKGKYHDCIYKTVKEFETETTLSKAQQLAAQKLCVRKGLLEVKLRGVPPKRHFYIKMDALVDLLYLLEPHEVKTVKSLKSRQSKVIVTRI